MDNDNDSISGSDATVALGGVEAEGNPDRMGTTKSLSSSSTTTFHNTY